MGNALSVLILGLSYGFVYFLLAAGMTLTMGLLRVVNMSHGAIFMFSGYCGVQVYNWTGSWILALLAGAMAGAILGLLLEICFLRKLYKTPANQVLLTIGFIYIIQNIGLWIWGGLPASVPVPSFFSGSLAVGEIRIPYYRFFVIAFGIIVALAIWLVQEKTKVGAMVRAGMDNGEVAKSQGLNNKLVFMGVFVLGSMVAGLSSMVGGALTGLDTTSCWKILLNSIIVVVIGGAGSIPGALIGGLIIGLLSTFGAAYFPMISSFVIYLALIVILVIRPQGLFGRKQDVDKAEDSYAGMSGMQERRFSFRSLDPSTSRVKIGAYKAAPYAFAVIVLLLIPFVGSGFTTSMFSKVLVFALFAMSLDIVMGYTGNRSFGHAAYFGMGAYVVALLNKLWGITNFWLVLLITVAVCAVLAAIIGYFTLRLTGTNFLLVTMAFGQLLSVIATKWTNVTGGSDGIVGIPRPDLGETINGIIGKWNNVKIFFFVFIIFVICYLIIHFITHSAFGCTLLGIRGNEGRMRALGFNTRGFRYTGMILAGIFAGIAGMLYAYCYRTVTPTLFALETSALPMLMVIMGGGATLWGPSLGAAVIILVQTYAGDIAPNRWPLILGGLYVLCVMLMKNGFAVYLRRFWDWAGLKFFAKNMKK